MSELVEKLCRGEHAVEFSARPARTVAALKESLDRGYVLVKFVNTRGSTELGVTVDRDQTDIAAADFDQQKGQITIVGGLTLDYVPVRCVANIDLSSLEGRGHLEQVAS
ncbi:MAG TPA: hypothetical protein VI485_14065 [Vicinamibacterales bacterium]|nr:hypothetical protein [Vicinamibacterales bacterium]